ncbi:HECT domain-containing family protein, partial [Reticulomyxa filosa]
SQWNQKLLFVFKLGKRLRQWIINEKQTLQQEHERVITQASEKGEELDLNQIKVSYCVLQSLKHKGEEVGGGGGRLFKQKMLEEKATYEGLCKEIIEKAKFLLSVRPYCRMYMEGLTSDEELPDFSLAVQISRLQSLERHASDTKSELESWKAAFSTWQTLNTVLFYKKQKKGQLGQQTSLPDLLLLELIDSRESDEWKSDKNKISGKRQKCLRSLSARITVMNEWHCPLREFGDKRGPKTEHFLSHIESCGDIIEKSLSKYIDITLNIFLFVCLENEVCLQIMKYDEQTADSPLLIKQQALNSWAVVLTQSEETFVANCKVMDFLHEMLAKYIQTMHKSWAIESSTTMSSYASAQQQSNTASPSTQDANKTALLSTIGIDWSSLPLHQRELNLQLVQHLYTLLSIVLVGFQPQGVKGTLPPTPDDLNLESLQIHVLQHFHEEARDHINLLSSFREKAQSYAHSQSDDSEASAWDIQADIRFTITDFDRSFLQAEDICFTNLVGIRTLTYSSSGSLQSFLKSKDLIHTLTQLLIHGSPRIKRVTLIVLRDILQLMSPTELMNIGILKMLQNQQPLQQSQSNVAKEPQIKKSLSALQFLTKEKELSMFDENTTTTPENPLDFIYYLFETTGALLLVQDDNTLNSHLKHEWSALDHTLRLSAEVKRDLGLDYAMLLRTLTQASEWKHLMIGCIYETLEKAAGIIDLQKGCVVHKRQEEQMTLTESKSATQHYLQVMRLIGCLAVLGGHTERLRPGCRVELKISEEEDDHMIEKGFCLSVSRSSGLCSVLFDNVTKPVTIEIKKVSPKSEISPLGCVQVTKELLSHFLIFTQPVHIDTRDPRKDNHANANVDSNNEEMKRTPITDTNTKTNTTEEEDKPKQDSGKKAPSSPILETELLPTTWICSACTLENPIHSPICDVCSSPNPNPPSQSQTFENDFSFDMHLSQPIISQPSISRPSVQEPKKEEKTIEIPQMVPEPSLDELLFYQLRSLGLKSLCTLLQQPEATKMLLEEKQGDLTRVLPHLLSIATRPMDLDQYRSVEYLEEQEDRLSEILHDKPLKWNERIPKSAAQLTQKQLLKYSPFRMLQVHLPSHLDTESASGITFSRTHEFRIMFKKGQHSIGYCRANNLIPLSIPKYYFEVKILKLGNVSDDISEISAEDTANDEKHWRVAVGLWRGGMNFQGDCGDQSSYGFGATGYAYSTISRQRISAKISEGFEEGDCVGVCWDPEKRAIFFTKNGRVIDSRNAFDDVNGQFYPMVWLQSDSAQVLINLGQEPMKYDFEKLLDPSKLRRLKEENQIQYTEAEIQRRTMAEELVRMMGGAFPLEFAVVTLEQYHDDLAMAADYLLTNASQELDRIVQNLSRSTDPSQNRDENKDDNKHVDEEEQFGLMAFIANNLDDVAGGGGDNSGRAGGRGAAAGDNLLDDEVDAQLPVGLTMEEISANSHFRNQEQAAAAAADNPLRRAAANAAGGAAAAAGANAGANEEEENNRRQIGIGSRLRQQLPPIHLQKVRSGQLLSIWSDAHRICHDSWQKEWKRLQGKTGIVHSVDVNNS